MALGRSVRPTERSTATRSGGCVSGFVGGIKVRSGGTVRFTARGWAGLRSHLPGVEDKKLSVGEGMIPTESRMLENSTSGLTSGGEETRARNEIEAPANGESRRQQRLPRSKAGAPPLDSTQGA